MFHPSSIADAYRILGLVQGAAIEEVKTTYRVLALRTHPDKNPDNPNATIQFQRISEAYDVLVKHLDQSARPSVHQDYDPGDMDDFGHTRPHDHSHPYDNSDNHEYYDYDGDSYFGHEAYEDDLSFHMFLFDELMKGRASRYSDIKFYYHQEETEAQYQAYLREEQEARAAADTRHAQEAIRHKKEQESIREKEQLEATQRQRAKTTQERGDTAGAQAHSVATTTAHTQLGHAQDLRSATFAAARSGDTAKVRAMIRGHSVDATGGEIARGCEDYVKIPPTDPKQTLMHIAAGRRDTGLVKWLDTHNADVEERDSDGLTAFHIALRIGAVPILQYFVFTYPPSDPFSDAIYDTQSSRSVLQLAIESAEPEGVWIVLDKALLGDINNRQAEIRKAWEWVNTSEGNAIFERRHSGYARIKHEEMCNLLMSFGKFSPATIMRNLADDTPPSSPSTAASELSSDESETEIPAIRYSTRATEFSSTRPYEDHQQEKVHDYGAKSRASPRKTNIQHSTTPLASTLDNLSNSHQRPNYSTHPKPSHNPGRG